MRSFIFAINPGKAIRLAQKERIRPAQSVLFPVGGLPVAATLCVPLYASNAHVISDRATWSLRFRAASGNPAGFPDQKQRCV
jgi:hypothetical protein